MIIFAPQSVNASQPCAALEQYELSRPPRNEQISQVFTVIYVLFVLLWLASIVWFWKERVVPRLSSVRPLWANLQLCIAHLLFSTFTALNLATDKMPCWFLLACLLFGLGGCAANFLMRMTLFVVESHFARLASAQKQVDVLKNSKSDDDDESSASSSSPQRRTWKQKLYAHYEHVMLIVGFRSIEQISLVSIAQAKSDVSLVSWFIVPLIVTFACVLAILPVYTSCAGCEVFAEMIIAFVLCLGLQSLLSARAAYIAWRAKFPDTQGLFRETFMLMFGCIPFAMVIVLLYVFDPNDVKFERRFDFEWIICLLLLMYWYASVGAQILAVQQYKSRIQLHKTTIRQQQPFTQAVIQALSLEEEAQFRQFAQKQFSVEHLNFAQDIIAFETYFGDRAENWRTSKARRIISTYIEPGSVMEINISYECRHATLVEFSAKTDRVPADLFKSAMQQVVGSVLLGIWLDYSSSKKATTAAVVVAPQSSPMFQK